MTKWKEVTLDEGLKLTVPAGLVRGREQGVDSSVTTWSGTGISILVDQGPFADALTSYAGRANYQSSQEMIDGRPARIVSFVEGDATRVVAAYFPGSRSGPRVRDRLTVVIRVDPTGDGEEVAFRIIRSLKFGGR